MRGGASALVILVMCVLLSLSAFRLMSSFADLKLARVAAGWTVRYYELEKTTNNRLRKTNVILADSFNAESSDFSRHELRRLEDDNWVIHEKDGKIYIHCDVSLEADRAQNLSVELLLSPPDENGRYYKIIQWRQWMDGFEYEREGLEIWVM